MSQVELIHLWYSPWSEKARWALDHSGVDYRKRLHTPMLGEASLRLRTGKLSGRVSVPVLLGEGWQLSDSFDIARWADRAGGGKTLFPPAHEAALRYWNEQSEKLLTAGRLRTTQRVLDSPEALLDSVPPFVAKLGRVALPVARQGARWLLRKYALDDDDPAVLVARMKEVLDALRSALADGRVYLLGELSYADITMAVALHIIRPVEHDAIRLAAASRAAWTDPELAAAYEDLLSWRDGMYERHRS